MAKRYKKSRDAESSLKDWTVMIYMAAENNSDLDAVAVEDLREMETGATDNVHVAVQINRAWPPVPQRYSIRPSQNGAHGATRLVGIDEHGTNMGNAATLTRFLKWAVREFPAKHYCLVLWGHAYGLGFGRDHNDGLTLKELRGALDAFRAERQKESSSFKDTNSDGRLELLGANACAMSYVEAAYELRNHATFMAASQIAVPYVGWPYDLILRSIDSETTAQKLGEVVVGAYVSQFSGLMAGERVTMSLLRLETLSALNELLRLDGVTNFRDLLEKFAVAISAEAQSDSQFGDRRAYVRDVFIAAASGDVRPLLDLRDLCEDFGDTESDELRRMTQAIVTVLENLVVKHNGHPELLEDLHGVGIFAPFVTDAEDLKRLELQDDRRNGDVPRETGRQAYQNLELFGEGATWPRLVYDELRQAAPSELMTRLTGLGASAREDRRDITQIVLAIESSFNKLDRVLAEARTCIHQELRLAEARPAPKLGPANGGAKRFGPPWLKLIQPPDLDAHLATLKQLVTLKAFERAATAPAGSGAERDRELGSIVEADINLAALPPELVDPMRSVDPQLVNATVDFFAKVEKALGEVERAARKGLTNARLGLAPSAPERFTFAEDPKTTTHGFAEDPKTTTHGFAEDPKTTTHGLAEDPKTTTHGANGFQGGARDLRVDLAFARVVELFGQVGQSLRQVEDAALELENTARTTISNAMSQHLTRAEMLQAAAAEILRGFAILEEASKNARRTIRSVFSHPVYGLGPGSGRIGLEERQALANAGGLSRRNLRLL